MAIMWSPFLFGSRDPEAERSWSEGLDHSPVFDDDVFMSSGRAFFNRAFWLVVFVALSGCTSTQVLRDKDYQYPASAFRGGNPEKALEVFPKKEQGGFITSVEKSWLGFWAGKPETKSLEKQSRTFDDRKFVSLTREAQVFLTQESEEGYVPSEHEVVVLHLVAAMNFMALDKWEDAEVEAKRAAFYLQNQFNENQPHFDDPALRVWLAAVWSALGRWDAAQVDLRRASALSGDKRLRELADGNEPVQLTLTFTGVGPDLEWKPSSPMPDFATVKGEPPKIPYTFSSRPWFDHHRERNTLLRDTLVRSNYMAQYIGIETLDGASRGVGSTAAITLGTIGVATGIAILGGGIYLAASAGLNGEALGYVLVVGTGIMTGSYDSAKTMYKDIHRSADEEEQRRLEDLRTYRLVRFMPNWISLETRESSVEGALTKKLKAPSSKTGATFNYVF
jgi:hypothetical protein